MHSNGFGNTVGVLGGGFSHLHAFLIRRWTSQIVILSDSDEAGKAHAKRWIETLNIHSNVNNDYEFKIAHVQLPQDEDPDSFLKSNGSNTMNKMIEAAALNANFELP